MIARDPATAAAERFDVIVVGGGIYGVCLAYEATKCGLRPLLIERDDFGGATSWNSLRIIHGGLRYLQTLDIRRHLESVRERRWFLQTFPEFVRPLPCMMPLYKRGGALKRPAAFRSALLVNDVLSYGRNNNVRSDRRLAGGCVLSTVEARLRFPDVRGDGLCGAALWHDAMMVSPQRILIEILRAACRGGAVALNYMEANALMSCQQRAAGIVAVDRVGLNSHEFRAPVVINAAGPWCEVVARECDPSSNGRRSRLFRPSLAFNLLVARPPLSDCALAVSRPGPDARVYFLYSACGGVLAGTEHVALSGSDDDCSAASVPTPEQVQRTLDELNAAIPGWDLSRDDVVRVYSGLLPAKQEGTAVLARRPMLCDHGRVGGPRGLYSVSGVKFTTARLVAQRVVARLPLPQGGPSRSSPSVISGGPMVDGIDVTCTERMLSANDSALRDALTRIMAEESVITSDDLLLRRTNWLDDPRHERAARERLARLLPRPYGEVPRCKALSASCLIDARPNAAMLEVRSPR